MLASRYADQSNAPTPLWLYGDLMKPVKFKVVATTLRP